MLVNVTDDAMAKTLELVAGAGEALERKDVRDQAQKALDANDMKAVAELVSAQCDALLAKCDESDVEATFSFAFGSLVASQRAAATPMIEALARTVAGACAADATGRPPRPASGRARGRERRRGGDVRGGLQARGAHAAARDAPQPAARQRRRALPCRRRRAPRMTATARPRRRGRGRAPRATPSARRGARRGSRCSCCSCASRARRADAGLHGSILDDTPAAEVWRLSLAGAAGSTSSSRACTLRGRRARRAARARAHLSTFAAGDAKELALEPLASRAALGAARASVSGAASGVGLGIGALDGVGLGSGVFGLAAAPPLAPDALLRLPALAARVRRRRAQGEPRAAHPLCERPPARVPRVRVRQGRRVLRLAQARPRGVRDKDAHALALLARERARGGDVRRGRGGALDRARRRRALGRALHIGAPARRAHGPAPPGPRISRCVARLQRRRAVEGAPGEARARGKRTCAR